MPEKSLNQIPRSLREQYEKGLAALHKENLDYAINILEGVLRADPAFYECREALRATQFKKCGAQGGLFKRLIGSASASPLLARSQLQLRSDPAEALRGAEQVLNGDPHNAAAHKLLAEAALACDLPQTAALSLEIVHRQIPADKDVGLKLGEALLRSRRVTKAESVLSELAKVHPRDQDIAMALKNASASRTLSEGGYEKIADGGGSYRDILRDAKQSVSLEQEHREHKDEASADSLIAEYQQQLIREPGNLRLLRALAEIHAQQKRFDESLAYYERITQTQGAVDPSIDKAIAETTARRFEGVKSQLDSAAPDYQEQSARIESEKQQYVLNDCARRVERYPADLQFRFEYGQLLFAAGRIKEAIQELQRAQANPHRRIQVLALLGQCFAGRGMHDLAARTFQNAIKEKAVFDDEKKELHYLLGCALVKLGKAADSIEQFKAIYEIDIGYRDVAARVDAFYAAQ